MSTLRSCELCLARSSWRVSESFFDFNESSAFSAAIRRSSTWPHTSHISITISTQCICQTDTQVADKQQVKMWYEGLTTYHLVIQHQCSVGMELPEAREAAQNRPCWRILANHSATHLWWCVRILDIEMVSKLLMHGVSVISWPTIHKMITLYRTIVTNLFWEMLLD